MHEMDRVIWIYWEAGGVGKIIKQKLDYKNNSYDINPLKHLCQAFMYIIHNICFKYLI